MNMRADAVWGVLLNNEQQGAAVHSALVLLSMLDANTLREAIARIDRETATGPLLNPSAYLNGERFRNAETYRRVLEALLIVRAEIGGEGAAKP